MSKRPKSSWGSIIGAGVGIASHSKLKDLNKSNQRLEHVQQEISNLSSRQLDVSNKILNQQELQVKFQQQEIARTEKQRELRNAIYILKIEIENILKDHDVFSRYFRLTFLENDIEFNNISVENFDQISDKEFTENILNILTQSLESNWENLDNKKQNIFTNLLEALNNLTNQSDKLETLIKDRGLIMQNKNKLFYRKKHIPSELIISKKLKNSKIFIFIFVAMLIVRFIGLVPRNYEALANLVTAVPFLFAGWFLLEYKAYSSLEEERLNIFSKLTYNTVEIEQQLPKILNSKRIINQIIKNYKNLNFLHQNLDNVIIDDYRSVLVCKHCKRDLKVKAILRKINVTCPHCRKQFECMT